MKTTTTKNAKTCPHGWSPVRLCAECAAGSHNASQQRYIQTRAQRARLQALVPELIGPVSLSATDALLDSVAPWASSQRPKCPHGEPTIRHCKLCRKAKADRYAKGAYQRKKLLKQQGYCTPSVET